MKDMREELEKILAGDDDEVEVFDPLEACPMEDLFHSSHDEIMADLIFSAGIMEAAKRILRKEKYCADTLRIIFGMEEEE